MILYLALLPGSNVGAWNPHGIYSTDLAAQEALQRMTREPIDWVPEPKPFERPGRWHGGTAKDPIRNPYHPPYLVLPVVLDDGGLSKFVYALDSDDARDLRTLVSERLGGEDAERNEGGLEVEPGKPAAYYRYSGVLPDGSHRAGSADWPDLESAVRRRFDAGWRSLKVCRGLGPIPPPLGAADVVAEIRPHPETGRRVWWAEGSEHPRAAKRS